MIYTRKILEKEQLDFIQSKLPDIKWVNGRVSGGGTRKINMQSERGCPNAKEVDDLLFKYLDLDNKFHRLTMPKITNNIMISKTPEGGHYLPHIDVAELGDFSTTIFLNDDYDGGELELHNGAETVSIKLPPGHAVTYKTGTPHTVKKVTSGERIVGVTWTTSVFVDDFHRSICTDIGRIMDNLPDDEVNYESPEDLEDWNNKPYEICNALLHKIKRAYGRL